jgi:hypothetical protein
VAASGSKSANHGFAPKSGSAEQLKKAYILLQDDPELHREATIRLNEVIDLDPAEKPAGKILNKKYHGKSKI